MSILKHKIPALSIKRFLAGPEGFEPSLTVLETGVLPLTLWACMQTIKIADENIAKALLLS